MLRWKINIIDELKKKGFSQSKLLRENILGSSIVTSLRKQDTNISLLTLDKICKLLHCQPGDLLEYVEE